MPIKPKPLDLPWIVKTDYNKLPGQGRRIISTFYHSKQWKKLRNTFIKGISYHLGERHPNAICIDCKRRGIITPTHTIDHIKPINPVDPYDTMNGRYGEALEWTNLQPLCASCNGKKTARDKS